jgi:uncharacterized protein (DUF1800 family)
LSKPGRRHPHEELPTLNTTPGDLAARAAVHLLNRIGYGPRPGDIRDVLETGLEPHVLDQLDPRPDPDLEARLRPLTTLGYPIAQVLALYQADQRSIGAILDEFVAAKVIRAVHGRNQLQEVLVDFWFNHFNVYVADGFARFSTPAYERDAIRPFVLGRFRDLLGATAAHPAMLFYLDNYLSSVSRVDPRTGRLLQGLNENYGRELLELHTVGVDAGYTQGHVFDAARCFTGWGIDLRSGAFVFRPQNHDGGPKSVFGLSLPSGGGRDDGERLLDHLATHPATARFVSRRLAQRFVADDPPESLVAKCASRFLTTGGDIGEVMKTLIGSAEFWAEAYGAGKPRTPVELVFGALRAVGAQVSGLTRGVAGALANMGMPLYQCLPPTGYTNHGGDWLNPSSQLSRMNFALELAAGALAGVSVDVRGAVRAMGGDPEDARSIANAVAAEVFGRQLSPATLEAAGRVSSGGPVGVAARVVGLCLASPDFQSR